MMSGRPLLVVVDLDRTLWPLRVDRDLRSPFLRTADGLSVVDARGVEAAPFPGAEAALLRLRGAGYPLAAASRAEDVAGAFQLLHLLGLQRFFSHVEVYPTCKRRHFGQLRLRTGVPYSDMLFLDDDARNLRQVATLGVRCRQVPARGLHVGLVQDLL